MACDDERKKVEDLKQKIKDFREMQGSTGLSKFALQAAWAWKYGTADVGILSLNSDLEEAEADLAACLGVSLVGSVFGVDLNNARKTLATLFS